MADGSAIEWCDTTWNPVRGCSRVSPGCDNCYAISMANRFAWGEGLTRVRKLTSAEREHDRSKRGERVDWTGAVQLVPSELERPLRWRKSRRIFVCSGADLFHPTVPEAYIHAVLGVAMLSPRHQFLLLTKRPARMRSIYYGLCLGLSASESYAKLLEGARLFGVQHVVSRGLPAERPWPLPNVWIGTSVEDQERADERIPDLLACPAAVRFVSAEPLLGPVDMLEWMGGAPIARAIAHHHRTGHQCGGGGFKADCPECGIEWAAGDPQLDWVIVGGESGARARTFDVHWAREIVKDCASANIPVFVKQLGARPIHGEDPYPISDRKGAVLDDWDPEIRVRQSPGDPCFTK